MKNIFIIILLVFLSGCAGTSNKVTTDVIDNNFYSIGSPKIKVEVNKEFEYLGVDQYRKTAGNGNDITYNKYIYVKKNKEDKAVSGIEIRINKITNDDGGSWFPDIFSETEGTILKSTAEVNRKQYQHVIEIRQLTREMFYEDKGLIVPNKVMDYAIARNVDMNRKVRFGIFYWEDLSMLNEKASGKSSYDYSSWLHPKVYDRNKANIFNDFLNNVKTAYKISSMTKADIEQLKYQRDDNDTNGFSSRLTYEERIDYEKRIMRSCMESTAYDEFFEDWQIRLICECSARKISEQITFTKEERAYLVNNNSPPESFINKINKIVERDDCLHLLMKAWGRNGRH